MDIEPQVRNDQIVPVPFHRHIVAWDVATLLEPKAIIFDHRKARCVLNDVHSNVSSDMLMLLVLVRTCTIPYLTHLSLLEKSGGLSAPCPEDIGEMIRAAMILLNEYTRQVGFTLSIGL